MLHQVGISFDLVLNTPDDGRLRPKHVERLCRNKTCTVLHQVGVSVDLRLIDRTYELGQNVLEAVGGINNSKGGLSVLEILAAEMKFGA